MTKIYDLKNQVPIYVEQKNIQTDLRGEEILKIRKVIPSGFIELETKDKNHMCSTQD